MTTHYVDHAAVAGQLASALDETQAIVIQHANLLTDVVGRMHDAEAMLRAGLAELQASTVALSAALHGAQDALRRPASTDDDADAETERHQEELRQLLEAEDTAYALPLPSLASSLPPSATDSIRRAAVTSIANGDRAPVSARFATVYYDEQDPADRGWAWRSHDGERSGRLAGHEADCILIGSEVYEMARKALALDERATHVKVYANGDREPAIVSREAVMP